MKLRDQLRTGEARYPENDMITQYKNIMMNMLHLNFPLLTEVELAAVIDNSITKHFKDQAVTIENNYKKTKIETTLTRLTDYLADREPIFTSAGVMFNRHTNKPNPYTRFYRCSKSN